MLYRHQSQVFISMQLLSYNELNFRKLPVPALFLDFDGTLVEIAEAPDKVFLHQNTNKLLTNLSQSVVDHISLLTCNV